MTGRNHSLLNPGKEYLVFCTSSLRICRHVLHCIKTDNQHVEATATTKNKKFLSSQENSPLFVATYSGIEISFDITITGSYIKFASFNQHEMFYRHQEPVWWKPSYFLLSGLPREEKENDSNLRTGLRMKAKHPEEIVMREEKL